MIALKHTTKNICICIDKSFLVIVLPASLHRAISGMSTFCKYIYIYVHMGVLERVSTRSRKTLRKRCPQLI